MSFINETSANASSHIIGTKKGIDLWDFGGVIWRGWDGGRANGKSIGVKERTPQSPPKSEGLK